MEHCCLSVIPHLSYHENFLKAEESCNEVGGYLADILDNAEADFIKSVLNVVNPKVILNYKYKDSILFSIVRMELTTG